MLLASCVALGLGRDKCIDGQMSPARGCQASGNHCWQVTETACGYPSRERNNAGVGGSDSWVRWLNAFCIPELLASLPASASICSQWPVLSLWGPRGLPFSALPITHCSLPPCLSLHFLSSWGLRAECTPHVGTLIFWSLEEPCEMNTLILILYRKGRSKGAGGGFGRQECKAIYWVASSMKTQLPRTTAGEGMGRMSRFQELKRSMMWGLGAWKYWLEVLIKCSWTNELCPAFCLVRSHRKT